MVVIKSVPPDGGYGWVIAFAVIINNIATIPTMHGIGLIFKDRFKDLGFSATDIALIMNSSAGISMLCGIFNAPLLRLLGCRKTSLLSGTLIVVGIMLTARASSIIEYVIYYGLIACTVGISSLANTLQIATITAAAVLEIFLETVCEIFNAIAYGMGMSISSYMLALNSYFRKRRTKVVGHTIAICGLGPILMPQLFSFLLSSYGVTGTVTIVSGIACHSYISALLLQPINWHMKKEIVEEEQENKNLPDKGIGKENNEDANTSFINKETASILSLEEIEVSSVYGGDSNLGGSALPIHHASLQERSTSIPPRKPIIGSEYSIKERKEEEEQESQNDSKAIINNEKKNKSKLGANYDFEVKEEVKKTTTLKSVTAFVVDTFDLTLLKDPTLVNIMVGMSFTVFAEMNFSLLTPFIMQDYNFDTQQIATFMSTRSVADICFRFIAPYVSDFFKKPVRIMYMSALLLLILSKSSLLLTDDYYILLVCAFFLGVAKGFRTVYWSLVIPNYVPIERLAAATGIQSTFNSIFVWIGGSFLGFVRDVTGTFKHSIVVINAMTFLTLLMWSVELLYKKYKSRK